LFEEAIQEQAPLAKRDRVGIYSNAWFYRLEESLKDDYSALARVLGRKRFSQLVTDYLRSHPSSSYTLNQAGRFLPDFLRDWQCPSKKEWYVDLAFLEKILFQTYFSMDPQPWSLESLGSASVEEMENLSLITESSVSIFESNWSIDEVWKRKRSEPREIKRRCLIYRRGFEVQLKVLRAHEFRVLQKINSGIRLGELLSLFPSEKTIRRISIWAASGIIRPASM
jgi:hypothetical protein